MTLHSRDHLSMGLLPWILHALGPQPLGPKRLDSPGLTPFLKMPPVHQHCLKSHRCLIIAKSSLT